jgi:replication factor A1
MGDEISATFFNQGADKFFPMLVENHVYTFAKGTVKLANKRFFTLQNEYNLSFDKGAEMAEVQDDGSIDNIRFALVGLNQLSDLSRRAGQTIVDICAVVSEIGETSGFTSKKGEPLRKRVFVLADDTNPSVELTLWNEETENPALQSGEQPLVLLAKGLKITEYNNLSIATNRNASKLIYNPVELRRQKG